MARLVKLAATGPVKIEPGSLPADKPVWLCVCGLSKKLPFCDGAHKVTRSEQPGMVYVYAADGVTVLECRPEEACGAGPPEPRAPSAPDGAGA